MDLASGFSTDSSLMNTFSDMQKQTSSKTLILTFLIFVLILSCCIVCIAYEFDISEILSSSFGIIICFINVLLIGYIAYYYFYGGENSPSLFDPIKMGLQNKYGSFTMPNLMTSNEFQIPQMSNVSNVSQVPSTNIGVNPTIQQIPQAPQMQHMQQIPQAPQMQQMQQIPQMPLTPQIQQIPQTQQMPYGQQNIANTMSNAMTNAMTNGINGMGNKFFQYLNKPTH